MRFVGAEHRNIPVFVLFQEIPTYSSLWVVCYENAAFSDRKLARDRARRRERLASETAEEKERRLSQRRVRDRARRAASRPSAHSEKARDRARRRERLASETAEEKERRYTCRTHSFTPSRWAAISPTSKRCGPGPSVVFY